MASGKSLWVCLLSGVTIYFCSLQQLTSSENVTDTSVNTTPETPGEINLARPKYRDHCVMSQPTRSDLARLCPDRNCATVHCVRSCDRWNLAFSRTSCFSKTCSRFTGEVTGEVNGEVTGLSQSGRAPVQFNNVSLQLLAKIFDDVVKGTTAWVINNVTVQCSDVRSVLLGEEFFVVISNYLDSCSSWTEKEPKKLHEASDSSNVNIRLVYFRGVSRWESYFKLPNFHSFADHKKLDSAWDVYTYDSLQSHDLALENNLEELLGAFLHPSDDGPGDNDTETDADVLRFAAKTGRCIKFNALGCRDLKIYKTIQRKMSALDNQRSCESINSSAGKSIYNLTQCGNDANDFDLDNTLLINDFLDHAVFSRDLKHSTNIFSIIIIDFADLSRTSELDSSLTRALSKVMSEPSEVFIFMSDIGDAQFSRFDNSVFLRLQTFNPLLTLFIPHANTSGFPPSVLLQQEVITDDPRIEGQEITEQKMGSIGFSDIRNILTTLMGSGLATGENNTESSPVHEINTTSSLGDQGLADRSGDLRLAKNVFGPVEGVCQGNRVHFPNDTIQAGFATVVIGRVNNKLQDLARFSDKENMHKGHRSVYFCHRLLGITFQNVIHVLWKNTTYILMTLRIGMKQGQNVLGNLLILETEIEYTITDSKTMNISIHFLTPRKVDIHEMFGSRNSLTDKLVHATCRPIGMDRDDQRSPPPRSQMPYFGAPSSQKSLHHPCLFLEVTSFPDSSVIDAVNYCENRTYNLTVGAKLVNTVSLTLLPASLTVRPLETRYVSTFVKSFYGASMPAYKLRPVFAVIDD